MKQKPPPVALGTGWPPTKWTWLRLPLPAIASADGPAARTMRLATRAARRSLWVMGLSALRDCSAGEVQQGLRQRRWRAILMGCSPGGPAEWSRSAPARADQLRRPG